MPSYTTQSRDKDRRERYLQKTGIQYPHIKNLFTLIKEDQILERLKTIDAIEKYFGPQLEKYFLKNITSLYQYMDDNNLWAGTSIYTSDQLMTLPIYETIIDYLIHR